MFLPSSWWRLTWKWLFKGGDGASGSKPLSVGSIRIATVALALGVCALSLTLAVFSGFQELLANRMIAQYGHVRYDSSDWLDFEDARDMAQSEGAPRFERAEFFWNAQILLLGKESGRGVIVEVRKDFKDLDASYDGPDELGVTMAPTLADILGVKEGDPLRILIPGLVKKALPARLLRLEGVGIHRIDSRRIVVDHASAWQHIEKNFPDVYARRLGDFHGIRFFLDRELYGSDDIAKLQDWQKSFALFAEKNLDDPLPSVKSWRQEKRNFFGSIAHDKRLVTVIIAMLSIVAALGVATSLLVLFFEKDRQIALIRALGMSKRQLRQWTTLQGFLMGVVASAVGFLLSLFASWGIPKLPFLRLPEEIYHVSQIPLRFNPLEQSLVLFFGIASATVIAFLLGTLLSRMPIVSVLGHRR